MSYTDKFASRAARRHERRPIDCRTTLLRVLLCSAANDNEPVYREGPPVWEWAIKTLCYFAASAGRLDERRFRLIKAAAADGIQMACEHEASSQRYWAKRAAEETKASEE